MSPRAFIIHGYLSHPDEAWLPWMKRELERHGCRVALPAMPGADRPDITEWKCFLHELVGEPDAATFLVGHSLGCQAVVRYLEDVGLRSRTVGKTVLVAGTFPTARPLADAIAACHGHPALVPWLSTGVDAAAVKRAAGECTVILSDNDPYFDPVQAAARFRATLDPRIVIVPGGGHFNEDDPFTELPPALAALFPATSAAP